MLGQADAGGSIRDEVVELVVGTQRRARLVVGAHRAPEGCGPVVGANLQPPAGLGPDLGGYDVAGTVAREADFSESLRRTVRPGEEPDGHRIPARHEQLERGQRELGKTHIRPTYSCIVADSSR